MAIVFTSFTFIIEMYLREEPVKNIPVMKGRCWVSILLVVRFEPETPGLEAGILPLCHPLKLSPIYF